MKQGLGFGCLAIVALACTACWTLFPRQTLEVEKLEMGMKPEAVRALIGEPEWVEVGMKPEAVRALIGERERVEPGHSLPGTWPGLQPEPSDFPATPTGLTETLSGVRATETWFYADEFVHPDIGTTRRTTCLHFEDERLAEWNFGYGTDCMEREATTGGQMVFDRPLGAWRVVNCGASAHGGHCAHYYHDGFFYRYDSDGWCKSARSTGPFKPIQKPPRTLESCIEDPITREAGAQAAKQNAKAEFKEFRKAAKQAIRGAEKARIDEAKQMYKAKIETIEKHTKEATRQISSEPDAKTRKREIAAIKRDARSEIKATERAKKQEIKAIKQDAKTKIKTIEVPERTYRSAGRGRRSQGVFWNGSGGGGSTGGGIGGGSVGGGSGGGSSSGGGSRGGGGGDGRRGRR
ncbi:MAG: hypothetical protein JRG90_05770 [Deltaproteobacteria bacterium]|nr:hypothetical protein [Deltaproteobacteria bacterium]